MSKEKEKTPRQIWLEEERKKRIFAEIEEKKRLATEGDGVYSGPVSPENEIMQSDWEKLAEIARAKFPIHLAEKFPITQDQRKAAIAWSLGWSQEKIAQASGVHRNTVSRWFKENENVKQFLEAFSYHNGSKDAKEVLDKEVYSALQTMIQLRDDVTVSASTRADAAKWIWEQKYGKAKESKEIKAINLRDLYEKMQETQLSKSSILEELDEKEEKVI